MATAPPKKGLPITVTLDVLGIQEPDDGLADGESFGDHGVMRHSRILPRERLRVTRRGVEQAQAFGYRGMIGRRGSMPAAGHCSVSGFRVGSVKACKVRCGAGPAKTLR